MSTQVPLLEARGISKKFGSLQALYDVDLTLYAGEVLALVGDNGAGKSTLIKSIAGSHRVDEGDLAFEGKPVKIAGPKDSAALGIEVVYQDLALCDNLTVTQNMFLGREETNGFRMLTEASMQRQAADTIAIAGRHHLVVGRPDRGSLVRRSTPVRSGR